MQILVAVLVVLPATLLAQPDTLWTRNFRPQQSNPTGLGLAPASDGGYFFGGDWIAPREQHGFFHSCITRTDSLGRTIWQKTPRFAERYQYFGGLTEVPDGGVLVAARGENNRIDLAMIFKLDQNGDSVWCNFYGEGNFVDIVIGADGSAVAAGSTIEYGQFGDDDAYVVKIDENGEVIWRRVFGGNTRDELARILVTPDDGYLLVGTTGPFGDGQGWLVKIDSEGRQQWSRAYGGQEGELFYAATLTPEGGYLAGGCSVIPREDGFTNVQNFLAKVDENGDTLWTHIFDNPVVPNEDDFIFGLTNSPGGGYLAVGTGSWTRRVRPSVLRLSEDGEMIWHLDIAESRGAFHDVLPTPDGGYLIGGENLWFPNGAFLVRVGPDSTALNAVVLPDPAFPSQFAIEAAYPNPFNSSTTITFSTGSAARPTRLAVYDVRGRLVEELVNDRLVTGSHSAVWNADGVGAGIYFVNLESGNQSFMQKIILLR